MSAIRDALSVPGDHGDQPPVEAPHTTAARGWEPRVVYGQAGPEHIYSPPLPDGLADEEALRETLRVMQVMVPEGYYAHLAEVKYDPAAWGRRSEFVTNPETGKKTKAPAVTIGAVRYRWVIKPIPASAANPDMDALMTAAAGLAKGRKVTVEADAEDRSLIVLLADWQIGQADGDGVEGVINRLAMIPAAIRAELARLRKAGTPAGSIVLLGLGDLVEGCTNDWYSNQAFTVELDRRQQVKVARRALMSIIGDCADTGLPLTVAAVAGNHGENRRGGKIVTTYADNDDLAVFEQVADAFTVDERRFGHIRWAFPEGDKLTLTLDVQGTIVGLTHGHLARSGGSGAMAKVETWLKGQALAREPISQADLLVTGHYHHFICADLRGRTWVQAPALCDRSEWFAQSFGLVGKRGLSTMTVTRGIGVDDVKVHDLDRMVAEAAAAREAGTVTPIRRRKAA